MERRKIYMANQYTLTHNFFNSIFIKFILFLINENNLDIFI